ncbi:MAG: YegS/Rv2252/BmrU family lipid kinase [Clostridiales bacterium]|nr:YegS/Rv2252/BmrU family lipid kinase [Clostridiales bacterium]
MKCLFLYNPVSGKGKVVKKQKYIVAKLQERFGTVDVYATQSAGELTEKAAQACGEYDVLVFAGGDGSFNEVVMGLGEKENRPVLGYIPTGTVNDIARSANIPRNIKGAVKNIQRGGAFPLDVMKVNENYVMYVAACGGLTGCSYNAKQSVKKRLGKIAYAIEVLKNDLVFDEYPVEFTRHADTVETSAILIMIMNGRSVASMRVNADAKLDDGKAEVIIVCDKPKHKEAGVHKHFRYFFSALRVFTHGYRRLKKNSDMCTYKGSHFTVRVADDVVWNFDGEKGTTGSVEVRVLPKHVNLIIPRPKKGKRSCLKEGVNAAETKI